MSQPRKLLSFLACCLLQLFVRTAYADDTRNITPEQWQKLTSDKALTYRDSVEVAQQVKEIKPGAIQRLLQSFFGLFAGPLGVLLLWLIVLGIVGYIIYRLVLSKNSILFQKSAKKKNVAGDVAGVEDIAATNWEKLMQKAEQDKDLRLAIRYAYMWLLQLLQEHELIRYRIDKTNYDYYAELQETAYKQSFRQLSRQYEYAWYGQYPIEDAAFAAYIHQFNQLKQQLQ
jgi:hypothetical protein